MAGADRERVENRVTFPRGGRGGSDAELSEYESGRVVVIGRDPDAGVDGGLADVKG